MKYLLASAVLLTTTSTLAHDTSFSSNSCDVELDGGIRITQSAIEFSQHNKPIYRIVGDSELIVDGKTISLNNSQQRTVTLYSTKIRDMVPEVKELAIDAIDLATDGVNMAFNELLGEGNDIGAEINVHLAELKTTVNNKFSSNADIYIDENGFDGEDFLGEEFEQHLEQAIEETVENSLGTILVAVGQELLFSGGDMDAFEARMETFGEQMEQEMESRAETLEQRSEELCQSAVEIDQLETVLSQEIEALKEFDLISATNSHRKSI